MLNIPGKRVWHCRKLSVWLFPWSQRRLVRAEHKSLCTGLRQIAATVQLQLWSLSWLSWEDRLWKTSIWSSHVCNIGGNTHTGEEVRNFSSPALRVAICFGRLRSKGAQNDTRCKESLAILSSCLSSLEKTQYTCQSEWVILLLLQPQDKKSVMGKEKKLP